MLSTHACMFTSSQVRRNAAVALSGAAQTLGLTRQQLGEVWNALWQALENSEQQEDFSEFKHAATLKEQASGVTFEQVQTF